MNSARTLLRRSATRIAFSSRAAMATTATISSSPSTLALTAETKPTILPLHHFIPPNQHRNASSRFVSSSTNPEDDDGSSSSNDVDAADSSSTPQSSLSSPLTAGGAVRRTRKRRTKKFVPRKAAVELTERARTLFSKLLANHPSKDGILLDYTQSSTGQPRMVFSFRFVSSADLLDEDEGVSLEVDHEGNPKPPSQALEDGLPKLYVHHNAFLKVLGATVDVDPETITPILYDKEGFKLDANA